MFDKFLVANCLRDLIDCTKKRMLAYECTFLSVQVTAWLDDREVPSRLPVTNSFWAMCLFYSCRCCFIVVFVTGKKWINFELWIHEKAEAFVFYSHK